MVKNILIAFAATLTGLLGYAALQPSDFRVERAVVMSAPAKAVFAQVNDFHRWQEWSPWAKLDPAAKATFAGPASGVGASFHWAGNREVGEGKMTITESRPHELIRINLEFLKPFKGTNTTEFTFRPEGSQTRVTWSMYGKNNYISKIFCMFMDMDKMVGGMYEKGLASIQAIVEKP